MKCYSVLCNYCGGKWNVWEWLWVLKMILSPGMRRYVRCPICGKVSQYRLVMHSFHDIINSEEMDHNKCLENVWRKG